MTNYLLPAARRGTAPGLTADRAWGFVNFHQAEAELSLLPPDREEGTMTFPVRDMGPPSPDDPMKELTAAAELHILLLPSDQSCAPAGERDSAD
jgi:hypothetical protein